MAGFTAMHMIPWRPSLLTTHELRKQAMAYVVDHRFHHQVSVFFLICCASAAKFSASLSSSADCSVILWAQHSTAQGGARTAIDRSVIYV